MSAEPYAAASGLLARAGAAFAASVPVTWADDGFFGPASVTWRLQGDLSGPVAGLRALMLQALHPLAMAGVDQHSDWRADPLARLNATSAYLTTITVGDRASAQRAAARVRRIHEPVRGVDPVTGQRYAAGDPALLLWVHAALVDSTMAAAALFGTPLSPAAIDRYLTEMVAAGELAGIPAALVPGSAAGLADYLGSVRPLLCASPVARESIALLLSMPGLDEDMAAIWQEIRDGAIAALPPWAAGLYGYQPAPLSAARRTGIRQALGVLDTLVLGEPGVLEARQRLELRIRAAHA